MKRVWGMPSSWSLSASPCEMKLSVEPESTIMRVEMERTALGEASGTSKSLKGLPAPGIAGNWLDGCDWELEVRAWQYVLPLPWRSLWWSLPHSLPAIMTEQRILEPRPNLSKHWFSG